MPSPVEGDNLVELERERLSYEGPDGPVEAYLARPASAPEALPGVLVIQEVWGVDGHIEDVADRLASAGYLALAPDLYSAGGKRPDVLAADRVEEAKSFLNTIPPHQWMTVLGDPAARQEALSKIPEGRGAAVGETLTTLFSGARESERHLGTLQAGVQALRNHAACGERPVGSVGFCMGGALSALLACTTPDLAAAAIFYGGSPPAERAAGITCPVRGFYGQDDPGIVSGLAAFEAALVQAGVDHELRIYAESPHAFFNDTRPSYRVEAARDAWGRLLAFFAEELGTAVFVGP